jgi:hypothetical protein
MDAIVKRYAEKLVKAALAKQNIKVNWVSRHDFDAAVQAIIAATPEIKAEAYKDFNS